MLEEMTSRSIKLALITIFFLSLIFDINETMIILGFYFSILHIFFRNFANNFLYSFGIETGVILLLNH